MNLLKTGPDVACTSKARMARASKRTKTTATSTVAASANLNSAHLSRTSAQPQQLIPSRPSLEHIPNEVLLEILSHLPTLNDHHVVFATNRISSDELVRTPTLRALSQTSKLLRSRCLAMAWQRIELCGVSLPKHQYSYYRVIGEATKTGVRVLNACPHLLPLIQTVSVGFTRYRSAEIIPMFAACLATLPNLSTIQIIFAHFQMATAIKNGFEGKRFPSVRKIFLPSSAHHIIKSCPDLEEVTCTLETGSTIIGSLVKSNNCQKLRVLKGISAPLPLRLVKALPNLRHISVQLRQNMTMLTNFTLLDTIELHAYFGLREDLPLTEVAASEVKEASKILKENKSQAEKKVIVTKWHNIWGHGLISETVKI
ncbi:hypothetical protein EV363DRAFT_1337933 [Boletus edulis]|nr:hypothetical protein EV363DRAFT_1337933 [Boletus edulis]